MSLLSPVPARLPLGKSGLVVSSLAWGMWRFAGQSEADARRLIHAVREAGIDFFDTADIYGYSGPDGFGDAETLFGKLLKTEPGFRDSIALATKGGIRPPLPYNSSTEYLNEAIDASLRRLGIQRIDLWQIHRPDILTHPQEIAGVMERAVAAGKIAHVGVSNFTPAQISALQAYLPMPIVSSQPEFSPLRIDTINNGELDQAIERNFAVLAWSPLGGGRLMMPETKREHAVADALDKVAKEAGASREAAAYSWMLSHPARPIPIFGTQKPERLGAAKEALRIRWSREDWYRVLVASRGEPLP